jgi:hypothetical protein
VIVEMPRSAPLFQRGRRHSKIAAQMAVTSWR